MSENNGWGVPNPPQEPQNNSENSQGNYQNVQPQYTQDAGAYQQGGQYPPNENSAYQQSQYTQNNGYYQQQYQAPYQQPQQNWGQQPPKNWGGVQSNYYAGYATVLRVFVILGSLVLPLIIWAIVGFSLADQTDGSSLILAFFGYIITAFVLWVLLSYKAKQFDLLSRIAKNTEAVYRELERINRGQ